MHPLIVSLAIDEAQQIRFDALRRQYFPPGRTVIGAHITLFHALPGELEPDVVEAVAEVVRRPGFDVSVDAVRSLGRGAAFALSSQELARVHGALRHRFAASLTPQDAQPFRPHITVQNKVTSESARTTVAELQARFVPFAVRAVGLQLWRYLDGPWEPVTRHEFEAP